MGKGKKFLTVVRI